MIVPPVASDVNMIDTMPLTVPTMETAAIAASPIEETSAVDMTEIKQIKNESSTRVRYIFRSTG